MSRRIPWETLEREFVGLYAEKGRPTKPIRLMVGLLLLKQIENLSDERVVEAWVQNLYYQAFCGMDYFHWFTSADGDTLQDVLRQVENVRGEAPQIAYCDRGFRGRKRVGATNVSIPGTPQSGVTEPDAKPGRISDTGVL